jgi:multiple sugar transport system ATP-binding protein
MGTKIVVMKDGEILQVGPPMEIYEYPVNMFVGGFIGSPGMNFLPGTEIVSKDERLYLDTDSFQLAIPQEKESFLKDRIGQAVILGIRPEHMEDKYHAEEGTFTGFFNAMVDVVETLGAEVVLDLTAGTHSMVARVDARTKAVRLEEITLGVNMDKIHIYESEPPHTRIKTEVR